MGPLVWFGVLLATCFIVATVIWLASEPKYDKVYEIIRDDPEEWGDRYFYVPTKLAETAFDAVNHPDIPAFGSIHPDRSELKVCSKSATPRGWGWEVLVEHTVRGGHAID